jgi:lipopolysaccharide transport system permease protein
MHGMLNSAWRYRFFITSSIKTELRSKFIRSYLGGLWMILNPLAQVVIFAFVLSSVLSAKLPGITTQYGYAIYLMSGILGWSLFSEIITRCLTLFIDNGNILKKISFPKIALPIIVSGSALLNNLFLLIAILLIFGILGHFPGISILLLPFVMAINVAFAIGLGLSLGILNVFVRDVGQIVPVLLQFIYWFTPIVYMADVLPKQYQSLLTINPLMPIINAYQSILLYNRAPAWPTLIPAAMIAVVFLAFSLILFRKASPEMVDQL